MRKRIQDHFWDYVEKTDSCWLWKMAKDYDGYGLLRVDRKTTRAHRYSYELSKGPIPNGMVICHTCDNPLCVNPDHLYAGTQNENMQDAWSKGSISTEKSFLTFDQKEFIRVKYKELGVTTKDLADEFGVSVHTIGYILRNEINQYKFILLPEQIKAIKNNYGKYGKNGKSMRTLAREYKVSVATIWRAIHSQMD